MNRRAFLVTAAVPLLAARDGFDVKAFDRSRILRQAKAFLHQAPLTITASRCERSAGGLHDFYSEGDYWWPDPNNPAGPYIQRDGLSNPGNFAGHRRALMRLSVQMPALVAAWILTGQKRYADHAIAHLRAWFVNPETRMNPNLRFAQAIQGRASGRATGIIDTVHLVEVARGVQLLEKIGDLEAVRQWFATYTQWMITHPYGIAEREAKNNHGSCWVLQVAQFASLTGNAELITFCRDRFRTIVVPEQFAADGSFSLEMKRTKPYGYSLFNLEALAGVCQILGDDLWRFQLPDGRGMRKAVEFMAPFIRDKKAWPLPPDVMYDSEWPLRQESLLFAGWAFQRPDLIDLWKTLRPGSNSEEATRNYFLRQPVLWAP